MSLLSKIKSMAAWCCFQLLPIDRNKVVFSSFYGKSYSGNPKAITQALLQKQADVKIIWLLRGDAMTDLPEGVTAVDYDSVRRIRELSTAKVWVDNCRKGARFKRKNQRSLQTWHGLALKQIERDAADKLPPDYETYARRDSAQCDAMVSNCAHMTKLYRNSFWYDGPVLEYGSPRNDLLLTGSTASSEKVHKFFRLPQKQKLVLYAPTFRADHSTEPYQLDCEQLRAACKSRFGGDWTVLIRLHPAVEQLSGGLFAYDGTEVCNATLYPDITELLAACDVVITDYSSLMFDFAITGRPCFQFAVDVEAYKNDRSFYFPLTGLPFPLADSNKTLCENIRAFDVPSYAAKWEQFSEAMGLREDGHAAERCADWILEQIYSEGV